MHFLTSNAPFIAPQNSVQKMMLWVLLALVPGIIAMIWNFGYGVLFNILVAVSTAVIAEAIIIRLRGRSVIRSLADLSAVVTAILLALSLPTIAPWWIPFIGVIVAIVFAKHLYGGVGYNPFNPAMIGFAVLIVSFPKEMTVWVLPSSIQVATLSFGDAFSLFAELPLSNKEIIDAVTAATPLDNVKTRLGLSETITEIFNAPLFGWLGGTGWEWVSLAYLMGGIFLIHKQVITWHIPAGLLAGLFVISGLLYVLQPGFTPSPVFHLVSGGAILGAFFIATDPVTAATTLKGRFIYGALIGMLTYIIRTWGGYPDGIAFAVILINMTVPLIDHYTRPRVYGHKG